MANPNQHALVAAIIGAFGAAIGAQEVKLEGVEVPLLALPNKDFVVKSLEQFLDAPNRTGGLARLHQYDGFVEYVLAFKEQGARIFVSPSLSFTGGGVLATAMLDYPVPGTPRWSEHTAEFVVQPSLEYTLLTNLDGKLLDQDEFARAIQKVGRFCTSMSGADVLELAQTLQLTSKGKFASINDDISGSINLAYDVQVKANAGTSTKPLTVPTTLNFKLPLLLGGQVVELAADFIYRIPDEAGGKVKMGIRLPDRLYVERDVLEATVAQLAESTKVPVSVGTSTVPSERGNQASAIA